jgi:hypothetical protein
LTFTTLNPFENMWPYIREATMHHKLDAIRAAALIAMSNESHVARQPGHRKILSCHVTYRSS